jgi:hypothetical protein
VSSEIELYRRDPVAFERDFLGQLVRVSNFDGYPRPGVGRSTEPSAVNVVREKHL